MNEDSAAFPSSHSKYESGLTKREYMALRILVGLAAATTDGMLPSTRDAVNLADRLIMDLKRRAR